jgi:hypothetical protein
MIGSTGDREFGVHLLEDAVLRDQMSSDTILLYTYGRYLMNGGDPERFLDLTRDDIQIMYISDALYQRKSTQDILTGLVKVIGKVFRNG